MSNPRGTTLQDTMSEIVVSTLKHYLTDNPIDNFSNNNALLHYMKKHDNVKQASGGEAMRAHLTYQGNNSFNWYSGYGDIDLSFEDVHTVVDFPWKQASISVIFSGRESKANAGTEALYELIKSRVENAMVSFENNLEAAMFSDGTDAGGLALDGLQHYVADDPTMGVVGGIDRATYDFWRNLSIEADSADYLNGDPTSSNIVSLMNKVTTRLTLGMKQTTNIIVCDNLMYELYTGSLQDNRQIVSARDNDLGFKTIKFGTIDMINAGGINGSCPSGHMYFLDTKNIAFSYLGDEFINEITDGGERFQQQDAYGHIFTFMGNMGITSARTQGLIYFTPN